jgi:YesN/AraC family two-component response regulator
MSSHLEEMMNTRLNTEEATPDRLIDIQETISVKKHHYLTPPYFDQHDFIEMIYVYKGTCYQYVETKEQEIQLMEGDLFLINQNVLHALYQPKQDDIIIKIIIPLNYIGLDLLEQQSSAVSLFDFLSKSVYRKNGDFHYLHFHTISNALIKLFVERMITEYYQKAIAYEEAICHYLNLLFIELGREHSIITNVQFEMRTNRLQHEEMLNYMRENIQTVTLDQLANEFSYNKCYLSRLISEEFGVGFQKLLRDIRMEKMESLIRYTNLPLEEIAELVGYKNAVMIYKLFREKYDMTPSEYRRKG